MSEGTMQRAAHRDQRDRRSAGGRRRGRVLVGAAAVPVLLLAAACSSGSDSGSGDGAKETQAGKAEVSASPSASPTVQAARYAKLPEACKVLSGRTLDDLVPKADEAGKEGTSSDVSQRASCSWDSLQNRGVKGSQFRWLNVSLLRFTSDQTRGTGERQAQEFYRKQVQDAQSVDGAKNTKAEPVSGTGDEATAVRYDLKKKEGAFKQQTVVARVANVVVTVDYNGAGLAGDKTPDADDLMKSAEKAAEEAVTAVAKANGDSTAASGSGSSSSTGSPSASASKGASGKGEGSASPSPSKSSSASASASASAAKS
ncbi:DUF3558 domain-containing protein [Streptomyces mexicanus]|uniref:DUF3558 domain-containing protein n=1 Tax=Streptomyces mexicanus TaxID=178566 RepID=A0A7X1HVS3_9ACTN|nr:DUF3558 domain-containing protein [Streptomyces mexicanus]MBC2863926.1 DUF3558 domain-containing protein [Streptomyces mexicanus]